MRKSDSAEDATDPQRRDEPGGGRDAERIITSRCNREKIMIRDSGDEPCIFYTEYLMVSSTLHFTVLH
jgi:hypothetical protein